MTRRYRLNPACTFLIRAFAPGCPTMLRSQSHKRVRGGERVQLTYNLPDGKSLLRAQELVRSAGTLRQIRIGRRVVRDLEAAVVDGNRLTVDALLVVHAAEAVAE